MIRPLVTLLLIAALDEAAPAQKRRLVAIVSPSSSVTNLSAADLRRTFLGGITRWPDGHRIVPVVLRAETWQQRTFLKRVVHMTDIDYAQHWIGEVFRGRASRPPHVAVSTADAVRFVAGHPHAIAVIDAEGADGSVRLLTIDRRAPDANDYPLDLSPVH